MSDLTKANVPGQVVGTTPAPSSVATQSQPAVEPATETASQEGTEAKPVTTQDLQALEERMSKQIQSQVDKSSARVQKKLAEVDQAVALFRASGREVTDADVKTLKQNVAAQAMIEPEESISPQTVDPLDASKWDPANPLTAVAKRMMAKKGVTLSAGDAETAMIDYTDGASWLETFTAALDVKAKRQSASKETTETKPTTTPAARIPASGGLSGGAPAKSGRELLGRAHKED